MQKQKNIQTKLGKLFFPLVVVFSLIAVFAFFIFTDENANLSSANNDQDENANLSSANNDQKVCYKHVREDWGFCRPDRTRARKIELSCDEKKYIHVETESCDYVQPPCTFDYSDWSSCQSNGTRTRKINASCGEKKYIHTQTESCEYVQPPCTFDYSDWSSCQSNGTRTRKINASCGEKKHTDVQTERCAFDQPPCTFDYSDWSSCRASWTQSRTIARKSPTNCQEGTSEPLVRNCIYSPPPLPCTDYNYSEWSSCENNYRTRSVISGKNPSGCSITASGSASPLTKQLCAIQNPSDNQASNTSQDIRPEFIFLELSSGTTLKGNFTIKGKVDSAKIVEFYSVAASSNTPVLIGSAKNVISNYWELTFDTTKKPNGSFYLTAKIKNDYGPDYYESLRVQIYINNLTPSPTSDQADNANDQSADAVTPKKYSQSEQKFSALPENFNDITSSEWQKKYFENKFCTNRNYCGGDADPDKDGLNNNDEFRYGTNPLNPDTDEDSFLDGAEIKNGFNPLRFSPGDKSDRMIFESPKESGEIKNELYQISTVALILWDGIEKGIFFTGKGLPNSFINIYIYSDLPTILTVKTSPDGTWFYVLDKQLADGRHEAYVAVTDNTGRITAKSEPLFFVKAAQAITIISSAEASASDKTISPAEKRQGRDLILIFSLIVLGFIASLASIGFYIIHLNKKTDGMT